MRMRRVHLSMRTEGIKAFSKQIRRCSVPLNGRTRFENDKCGRKRSKTAPFSFENRPVWTGPKTGFKFTRHEKTRKDYAIIGLNKKKATAAKTKSVSKIDLKALFSNTLVWTKETKTVMV